MNDPLTDTTKRQLRLEAKKMVQEMREESADDVVLERIGKLRKYAERELNEAVRQLQIANQDFTMNSYIAAEMEAYLEEQK